jgi:hypothetical protein
MRKLIMVIIPITLLLLNSCGEDKICDCIRSSDALLKKYQAIDIQNLTEKDKQEILVLKKDKKAKCEAYEMMSGEELLERKGTCRK